MTFELSIKQRFFLYFINRRASLHQQSISIKGANETALTHIDTSTKEDQRSKHHLNHCVFHDFQDIQSLQQIFKASEAVRQWVGYIDHAAFMRCICLGAIN